MAKILFTAFMADARGKVAGTVFSKNRSGAYTRTKVSPSNPRSPRQTIVRATLGSLSAQWRGLTQAQRNAWSAAVEDYKRTNQLGNTYRLTGATLFISLNANLTNAGLPIILDPVAPSGVLVIPIIGQVSPAEVRIQFVIEIPTGFTGIIRATPPVSAGRQFVDNLYRQIAVQPAGNVTSMAFTTQYIANFGVPVSGQNVGLEMYLINNESGQKSNPTSDIVKIA